MLRIGEAVQVVVPEPVSGLEPSGRFVSGDKARISLLQRVAAPVAFELQRRLKAAQVRNDLADAMFGEGIDEEMPRQGMEVRVVGVLAASATPPPLGV